MYLLPEVHSSSPASMLAHVEEGIEIVHLIWIIVLCPFHQHVSLVGTYMDKRKREEEGEEINIELISKYIKI